MYYYWSLVYHINILFRKIKGVCFYSPTICSNIFVIQLLSWIILFRASIVYLWTPSYYKITVLRFVWDRFVFTQYSYYREFFYLGRSFRLHNRHCHVWVRFIDITKITVWFMSSLLLSIYLRWFCYFIMVYFKLNDSAMVKW